MAKIKNFYITLKQLFSQLLRAVMGRDEANDIQDPSTQRNRYYS